ncbi:MAG: L-threonylcarbamoyladenylate synthase [Candidatus Omnitrophota bacterium]
MDANPLSFKKIKLIKVDPDSPDESVIDEAARAIRGGALVAFPTETVYGLAANLLDEEAVDRLYRVKNRPRNKPFTIHVSSIDMVREIAPDISGKAGRLIDKFWPGPLTIILNSKDGEKVGFRMPANKIALSLIEKCGVPVVAPSANISGNKPPTNADEVLRDLDDGIDMILDGGPSQVGRESTVVDATASHCAILREGAVAAGQLRDVWGDGM